MRYIPFVCVDPTGETYVPEEDNIIEIAAKHPHGPLRPNRNPPMLGGRVNGRRSRRHG